MISRSPGNRPSVKENSCQPGGLHLAVGQENSSRISSRRRNSFLENCRERIRLARKELVQKRKALPSGT